MTLNVKGELEALSRRIESLHPDESIPQAYLSSLVRIVREMAESLEDIDDAFEKLSRGRS